MVSSKKANIIFTVLVCFIVFVVSTTILLPHLLRVNTSLAADLNLPAPNQIIKASNNYHAPVLRGLKIDKNNPYKIEFLLEEGKSRAVSKQEQEELIKYFLSALTVKNEDLWVNLSPYESDRILASNTQKLDIGAELLKQDYILKQFASSLTDPNSELGIKFWKQNKDSNSFNKVWIVPDTVELYQEDNVAYINRSSLDVKSEQDYLAQKINAESGICSVNEDIIKAIKSEVNNGQHFATLRQLYHSIILAQWFKANIKNKLAQNYVDQNKLKGIEANDQEIKDKVFELYTKSFNEGVYRVNKKSNGLKRQYLSGGVDVTKLAISSASSPIEPANEVRSLAVKVSEMKKDFELEFEVEKVERIQMTAEQIHVWLFELVKAFSMTQIGMLEDLKKIDFSEHRELLTNYILPALYPMANQVSGMVKDKAMEAMAELSIYMNEDVVNNQIIPFLVKKGNVSALRMLNKVNNGRLTGKLVNFLELLLYEVDSHVEVTEESLSQSLQDYFSIYDVIDEVFLNDLLAVFKFTEAVHYHIVTSLSALHNVGLRVSDVKDLRKHLSYGTPINSIVCLLGMPEEKGGFPDLTRKFVSAGRFDNLFEVVMHFVEEQRAGSVQTLYGVLKLLNESEGVLDWGYEDWVEFYQPIEDYYEQGIPVLTSNLYRNYIERMGDPKLLDEFVNEVKNALSEDLAFGSFTGFDQEFMNKYGLTTLDELGLVGQFKPIVNQPAQAFVSLYEKIKQKLIDNPAYLTDWDEKYHKRYYLNIKQNKTTAFHGNQIELDSRITMLKELFNSKIDMHDLEKYPKKRLMYITSLLLNVASREERVSLLGKAPKNSDDIYDYLVRTTIFMQKGLNDYRELLENRLELEINSHKDEVKNIIGDQIKKKYISISGSTKFHGPTKQHAKILRYLENDKVTESEVVDWLTLQYYHMLKNITQDEIKDNGLMKQWFDGFHDQHVKSLTERSIKDFERVSKLVGKAFWNAVESIQNQAKPDDLRKIEVLKKTFFYALEAAIEGNKSIIKQFEVNGTEISDRFYGGIYRDLFHQLDFMPTGSCLKSERPERISTGKHHATIELQNSTGRYQGSAMLEVVDNKFWETAHNKIRGDRKILTLFGISLGHKGGLELNGQVAFESIVDIAKRYADENNYLLVIPNHSDVMSNFESDRRLIRSLYADGKAIRARYESTQVLSRRTYSYDEVFIVNEVNDVVNDTLINKANSSALRINGGIDFKALLSNKKIHTDQFINYDPNILGYSFEITLDQPLEIFSDFFTSQNL